MSRADTAIPSRRRVLLGASGLAGLGAFGALSSAWHLAQARAEDDDRYFVLVYFNGGWDVLLGLDPRDPGVFRDDLIPVTRIQVGFDRLADNNVQLVDTGVPGMILGPYAQSLGRWADQVTVVRGMSMETLTHEVGRRRFITGRPPSGLEAVGSSFATHLAANLGINEPIPNLAGRQEAFNVDQPAWASELAVLTVDDLVQALSPRPTALPVGARTRVSALMSQYRGCDVVQRSRLRGDALDLRESSYDLVDQELFRQFDFNANTPDVLALREHFQIPADNTGSGEALAAMASIALRSGSSRVVSFTTTSGLDTHFTNWETDAGPLQEAGFRNVANLASHLEQHEYKDTGESWLDRTVILGFSEFARTPLINGRGGRDHHLMNACFLLGGGIPGGRVLGASSDVGMAPRPVNLATGALDEGGDVVRPEHILRALMTHGGITDDVAGLGVEPYRALLPG